MNSSTAAMATSSASCWHLLCERHDLIPFSGVAAWLETSEGPAQVAIFYLPGQKQELYAIDNHDPLSGANVMARGIIGDLDGQLVVASPLYKQHYRLEDGQCLEEAAVKVRAWNIAFDGDNVLIYK